MSIITLIITLSFIFPYVTWAFESPGSIGLPKAITYHGKPITIPEKYGTIEATFQGSHQTVLCIQDLHCQYEVQKNISHIISQLHQQHHLNLIGEEGGAGKLDMSVLKKFPLQDIKEGVADYFVKQGRLTGAEQFTSNTKDKIDLEGVENKALYDQSYADIQSFLNAETQGQCYDLRDALEELKPTLYNPALYEYDKKRTAYHNGEMDLLNYAVSLKKAARKYRVDTQAFPALNQFLSLHQNYFSGDLDSSRLMQDINQLDKDIRGQLYNNPNQQKLDQLTARLDIMEKLLNISVTQEELKEFRAHRQSYTVKAFTDFIKSQDRSAVEYFDMDLYSLDDKLKKVEDFYNLADQRSKAFVDNMLAKMKEKNQSIALMVNGGFHIEKILQELKKRDVSYVSIKPKVTRQDIVNPYFDLLQGQKSPLERLLAQNQTIFAPQVMAEQPREMRVAVESLTAPAAEAELQNLIGDERQETTAYLDTYNDLVWQRVDHVIDAESREMTIPNGVRVLQEAKSGMMALVVDAQHYFMKNTPATSVEVPLGNTMSIVVLGKKDPLNKDRDLKQALAAVRPRVTLWAQIGELFRSINLQAMARSLWQPMAQRARQAFQDLQQQFTVSWQDLGNNYLNWNQNRGPATTAILANPLVVTALIITTLLVAIAMHLNATHTVIAVAGIGMLNILHPALDEKQLAAMDAGKNQVEAFFTKRMNLRKAQELHQLLNVQLEGPYHWTTSISSGNNTIAGLLEILSNEEAVEILRRQTEHEGVLEYIKAALIAANLDGETKKEIFNQVFNPLLDRYQHTDSNQRLLILFQLLGFIKELVETQRQNTDNLEVQFPMLGYFIRMNSATLNILLNEKLPWTKTEQQKRALGTFPDSFNGSLYHEEMSLADLQFLLNSVNSEDINKTNIADYAKTAYLIINLIHSAVHKLEEADIPIRAEFDNFLDSLLTQQDDIKKAENDFKLQQDLIIKLYSQTLRMIEALNIATELKRGSTDQSLAGILPYSAIELNENTYPPRLVYQAQQLREDQARHIRARAVQSGFNAAAEFCDGLIGQELKALINSDSPQGSFYFKAPADGQPRLFYHSLANDLSSVVEVFQYANLSGLTDDMLFYHASQTREDAPGGDLVNHLLMIVKQAKDEQKVPAGVADKFIDQIQTYGRRIHAAYTAIQSSSSIEETREQQVELFKASYELIGFMQMLVETRNAITPDHEKDLLLPLAGNTATKLIAEAAKETTPWTLLPTLVQRQPMPEPDVKTLQKEVFKQWAQLFPDPDQDEMVLQESFMEMSISQAMEERIRSILEWAQHMAGQEMTSEPLRRHRDHLLKLLNQHNGDIDDVIRTVALAYSTGGIGPLTRDRLHVMLDQYDDYIQYRHEELGKPLPASDAPKKVIAVSTIPRYSRTFRQTLQKKPDGLSEVVTPPEDFSALLESVPEKDFPQDASGHPLPLSLWQPELDDQGKQVELDLPNGLKAAVWKWEVEGKYGKVVHYFFSMPSEGEDIMSTLYPTDGLTQTYYFGQATIALQAYLAEKKHIRIKASFKSEVWAAFDFPELFRNTKQLYQRLKSLYDRMVTFWNDHTPKVWADVKSSIEYLEQNFNIDNAAARLGFPTRNSGEVSFRQLFTMLADVSFGVAHRHAEVMTQMPAYKFLDKGAIQFITNGVSQKIWQHPRLKSWRKMSDEQLLKTKQALKLEALTLIQKRAGLDEGWAERVQGLTLGVWMRRIVPYKLLQRLFEIFLPAGSDFHTVDLGKLSSLLQDPAEIRLFLAQNTVVVFGGRVHQNAHGDRARLSRMINILEKQSENYPELKDRIIFFPDHNTMDLRTLAAGADYCFMPSNAGEEASGTSNQKYAFNAGFIVTNWDGNNLETATTRGPDQFVVRVPYDAMVNESGRYYMTSSPQAFLHGIMGVNRLLRDDSRARRMKAAMQSAEDKMGTDRVALQMLQKTFSALGTKWARNQAFDEEMNQVPTLLARENAFKSNMHELLTFTDGDIQPFSFMFGAEQLQAPRRIDTTMTNSLGDFIKLFGDLRNLGAAAGGILLHHIGPDRNDFIGYAQAIITKYFQAHPEFASVGTSLSTELNNIKVATATAYNQYVNDSSDANREAVIKAQFRLFGLLQGLIQWGGKSPTAPPTGTLNGGSDAVGGISSRLEEIMQPVLNLLGISNRAYAPYGAVLMETLPLIAYVLYSLTTGQWGGTPVVELIFGYYTLPTQWGFFRLIHELPAQNVDAQTFQARKGMAEGLIMVNSIIFILLATATQLLALSPAFLAVALLAAWMMTHAPLNFITTATGKAREISLENLLSREAGEAAFNHPLAALLLKYGKGIFGPDTVNALRKNNIVFRTGPTFKVMGHQRVGEISLGKTLESKDVQFMIQVPYGLGLLLGKKPTTPRAGLMFAYLALLARFALPAQLRAYANETKQMLKDRAADDQELSQWFGSDRLMRLPWIVLRSLGTLLGTSFLGAKQEQPIAVTAPAMSKLIEYYRLQLDARATSARSVVEAQYQQLLNLGHTPSLQTLVEAVESMKLAQVVDESVRAELGAMQQALVQAKASKDETQLKVMMSKVAEMLLTSKAMADGQMTGAAVEANGENRFLLLMENQGRQGLAAAVEGLLAKASGDARTELMLLHSILTNGSVSEAQAAAFGALMAKVTLPENAMVSDNLGEALTGVAAAVMTAKGETLTMTVGTQKVTTFMPALANVLADSATALQSMEKGRDEKQQVMVMPYTGQARAIIAEEGNLRGDLSVLMQSPFLAQAMQDTKGPLAQAYYAWHHQKKNELGQRRLARVIMMVLKAEARAMGEDQQKIQAFRASYDMVNELFQKGRLFGQPAELGKSDGKALSVPRVLKQGGVLAMIHLATQYDRNFELNPDLEAELQRIQLRNFRMSSAA